ncbi:hypothetical protein M1146_05290 [Patescibacteria group bacterium]|nr:hypothetical protein [Patescibacteria group bacterium]
MNTLVVLGFLNALATNYGEGAEYLGQAATCLQKAKVRGFFERTILVWFLICVRKLGEFAIRYFQSEYVYVRLTVD